MQSAWSFCLLILSILAAGVVSKRTVRLYFVAQGLCTLAEYFSQFTSYYNLVYICCTLLMVEMSVFLLWDAGVSRLVWKDALLFGIWMTIVGGLGLEWLSLTDWYVLGEGLLFAALGIAMLKLSIDSVDLRAIGTLTLGMAVYDFLYLLQPGVRATNGWLPSLMCSVTFLWIASRRLKPASIDPRQGAAAGSHR